MIRAFSRVPRKPRDASSKSFVSENGSAFSVAACRATTDMDASLGASLVPVWVMSLSSLKKISQAIDKALLNPDVQRQLAVSDIQGKPMALNKLAALTKPDYEK